MKNINRILPMDLICVSLDIDYSDEEIKECIDYLLPMCNTSKRGACFSINGFDDDERALWQIPEVVSFMKRLIKLGFMSTLEISTTSPELVRKHVYGTDELPGLGALELWMMANGKMINGFNEVTSEDMNMFLADLNDHE